MFNRYINLFFIFWVFALTAGCGILVSSEGSTNRPNSDLIIVEVAPEGVSPEVFYNGHEAICRRGMPGPDFPEGLDRPETAEAIAAGTEGATPAAQVDGRDEITTVQVSPHWFSVGLNIANSSTEYFLVIEQLVFVMSAQWGGELLTGRKEISSGYCGTDPIYIVPYGKLEYEPGRRNHPNNLTLFVDGVPFPTGPPISLQLQGIAGGGVNAGAQPGGGVQQPGGAQQPGGGQQPGQIPGVGALSQNDEYVPDRLPDYRVQLVLHGYFIDKERKYVANFKKDIIFYTTSTFLQ